MIRPKWLVLLVALPVLLFALGACSDDDEDDGPAATDVVEPLPTDAEMDDDMESDSLQIEVVSQSLSFSPDVIEAPEAVEVTIVYENAQDGVQHNLAIYMNEEDATNGVEPLAATAVAQGPDTQELTVGPLPAGDYFVWCQVHTSLMTATFSVE